MKILETVKNFIKKNKKLVTVVSAMFCAVVLVAGSIAGTIAYLTSTAQVTNTFTVGNVKITMDEAKVDANGKKVDPEVRWADGNAYKLFPGKTYDKDPTIHVDANSEACWLFVKVVNELAAIEGGTTISEQMTAKGWKLVSGETDVYYLETTRAAGANEVIFEHFTIADNVDNATLATYKDKTIVVTAYAIQADGFATAAAAWAASGWATPTP